MRTQLLMNVCGLVVCLAMTPLRGAELPTTLLRVEADAKLAQIPFLSWDTEGGDRAQTNLLRGPVELRLRGAQRWVSSKELPAQCEPLANRGMRYQVDLAQVHKSYTDGLVWEIIRKSDHLVMTLSSKYRLPEIEMVFPFNMRAALTTALASRCAMDGTLRLPAVLSAPDFGQMLVSSSSEELKDKWSIVYDDRDTQVKGRLEGSRRRVTMDLVLSWPRFLDGTKYTLEFRPVWLPVPKGLKNTSLWPAARRGWFNAFEPTANHCSTEHDRLKASFAKTLYNPATGWLAGWKSADGQLHDYAWPSITGMAIAYGLVEPAQGRQMLARLWKKVGEVGFKRFDLGLPCTLVPVHRGDYIGKPQFDAMGEDGTGQFGKYLNGGGCVSDTIDFLTANYMVGEHERADLILRAMLERQQRGGFQNGYGNGGEFLTWDGKPCGYEGHLTYSWSFLQAVLLREPQFRARLYRPLMRE